MAKQVLNHRCEVCGKEWACPGKICARSKIVICDECYEDRNKEEPARSLTKKRLPYKRLKDV